MSYCVSRTLLRMRLTMLVRRVLCCVRLAITSTCLHTYIRAYVHTQTHTHTCIHTHTRTYIHAYILVCVHTYIHTCVRTYVHTYINTYIHTYILVCIHTYVNTYIHHIMQVKYKQSLACNGTCCEIKLIKKHIHT